MSGLNVAALEARGVRVEKLSIAAGHCASLSGPSGSGKTLLLRAIADLDDNQGTVRSGSIVRDRVSGPAWRRAVGYVAAESHWWQPRVGDHADDWPETLLQRFGFGADVLDWEIQRLSSGERQRLGLIRTLAQAPRGLLLDEPTANLDDENTARIEAFIADWRDETSGWVLWVSHDPEQRLRIASGHYVITAGKVTPQDAG